MKILKYIFALILLISIIVWLVWLTGISMVFNNPKVGNLFKYGNPSDIQNKENGGIMVVPQFYSEGYTLHRNEGGQQLVTLSASDAARKNTAKGYKKGKDLVYDPITGCKPPQLMDGYSNTPCWKFNNSNSRNSENVACAPRVVILGIHKCGTTDIRWALNSDKMISCTFYEPYYLAPFTQQSYCPTDLYTGDAFKSNREKFVYSASRGHLISISCGGCFNRISIVEERRDQFLVRSAIQLLTFYQSEKTRYIISLRNPTDRTFSHYFYFLKINKYKDTPAFAGLHTPESIGFDFLHKIIGDVIKDIETCLDLHGTAGCLLLNSYDHYLMPIVTNMVTMGCYAIFLEEIFRFVPRDQIYVNMLEEYSADESGSLKDIYQFIGLNTSNSVNGQSVENKVVRNQGSSQKPVHDKTLKLLDKFYEPFNNQLADLLKDDKWMYIRK